MNENVHVIITLCGALFFYVGAIFHAYFMIKLRKINKKEVNIYCLGWRIFYLIFGLI